MWNVACKFFFLRAFAKVQSNLKGKVRIWYSHSYANTLYNDKNSKRTFTIDKNNTSFICLSSNSKKSIQKRQLFPLKVTGLQEIACFFPK